jgi:hypothetical protein
MQIDQTQKNPLDEKKYEGKPVENTPNTPNVDTIYKSEDKDYLTFLQTRLENGKTQKNQSYPEYNGKNYTQIYDENEKIANTMLDAKKNDDDVIVSAGTVEAKLDALLANINNLDLSPDVFAFDKENNNIAELGIALQDTIAMTEELDGEGGDEEKKLLRQRELLKQGTVFVQEEWLKLWETKKVLTEGYNGQFKDWDKWEEKLELVFEGPSRTLLYGPNVYLGNVTEFTMERQPYIFAVIHQDYKVAEAKYGKFENWKYVVKGAVPTQTPNEAKTIFDNKWRLTEITKDQVEIILYQDKPRDEFQIIINGVMMLPIGFPLSAVCPGGNYNIAKQVFRVINHKFAYGKSFVSSGAVKEISALIDEMLKLFVLKTRKSFSPAYINTSGKVIPKKVLSPGRISMGIAPDALQKIGEEGQGVTSNEFQVFKELQEQIDKSTVSNQFAGQQGHAGTTATEVVELQRQAKLVLGLTIAACGLLEKKLAYLRLWNILANWFNPVDTKVVQIGDVRKEIRQYRNTYRKGTIEGAGTGERYVIPTDQGIPDEEVIRALEIQNEKEKGFPVRRIYIDPEGLKVAKLRWYVVINPKEKETSAFYKLLFREELTDIMTMMQLGSVPNKDGLEEKFSRVYQENRNKVFSAQQVNPAMAGVSGAMSDGMTPNGGTPSKPQAPANKPGMPKTPIGA